MKTEPRRIETAVDRMNMAPRIKSAQDLSLEFRYALVGLLGTMGRRIAVQLIDPEAYGTVKGFIGRSFPIEPRNSLRRFLAGEFTDGVPPVVVPTLQRLEVAKILRVMDVIELMASEHDGASEITEK